MIIKGPKYAVGDVVTCVKNPFNDPLLTIGENYRITSVTVMDNLEIDGGIDIVWSVKDINGGPEVHSLDYFELAWEDVDDFLTTEDKFDDVTAPKHYADSDIEPIDFMRASFTKEEFRGAMKINIIKYVSRFDKKDGVKDLRKAKQYLNWLIEREEI